MERFIIKVCQIILWLSTSVIFFILCANTILRYATQSSLQWANEVPELLFPWLVMAGVVLAAVHGSHITTSFLMDAISPVARRWVKLMVYVLTTVLYGTLFVATWQMLEIVHDEKSPILHVPNSVTFGCVMVGLGLLALLAIEQAWRTVRSTPEQLFAHSNQDMPAKPMF